MTFHNNIGRFAGGFADMLTGDRYDFDKLGSLVGNKPTEFMPEKNIFVKEDDNKGKGMLDNFLLGLQSYNPEKNKTESDKLFDSMATRGASGGKGSFQEFGNTALYTPDNSARNLALLEQQKLEAQQAAQAKENRSNVGRMAGAAIGNAILPGVGGVVGGLFGGFLCDIRLKEDIAPLCVSEVNDVLSECAFFVKNLNECS